MAVSSLRVDELAVRLVEADLAAVLEHADADAVGLLRHRIPHGDVGDVERHLLRDDAARLVLHRVRTLVLLHLVHSADDDVRLGDPRDLAALALVAARDDDHVVALPDLAHCLNPQASATALPARARRSS